MSLVNFCTWLNDTAFSIWLREAPYPYPVLLICHIFAIALFGGLMLLLNLRVLGWALPGVSVSYLLRQSRPWKWLGFALLALSGTLIAASDPLEYYSNPMFWISLGLLGLLALNGGYFHTHAGRAMAAWDSAGRAPQQARFWAGASLCLWVAMIFAGRAIAFF